VIYAAKSTEDLRGSIPGQIADCRAEIDARGAREVDAESVDEAVSGFSRSRGLGLARAMRRAAELAERDGIAELWVQHSDRLARGDGKQARHVVEIALWALKANVSVRSVQDPDTFRDLLYAVVTGQRNYEDSRRKALATSAGKRRSAERGEWGGHRLDGYRLSVAVDDAGHVIKGLEFDPDRKPLFELIFRRALAGDLPVKIAERINKDGWRTVITNRSPVSVPFSPSRIRAVLANPRYAGLAVFQGEVVGKGQWPGYITPRQHERLQHRRRKRERGPTQNPREPFLLARLAVCGRCGASMITIADRRRKDGVRSRSYSCIRHNYSQFFCDAPRLDAAMVDAVFVSNLTRFLPQLHDDPGLDPHASPAADLDQLARTAPVVVALKRQIHEALAHNDDVTAERLLDDLIDYRQQLQLSHHGGKDAGLQAGDPLDLVPDDGLEAMRRWSEDALAGRLRDPVRETERLNRLLRSWFTRVEITRDLGTLTITAQPRPAPDDEHPAPQAIAATADIGAWYAARQTVWRIHRRWSNAEIEEALRTWTRKHGRPPRHKDWITAAGDHPPSTTVNKHYGPWKKALKAAGVK
jgi:hypothetical protein